MAKRNMVAWRYTDDLGSIYVRRADAAYTAQQGNNAPLGSVGGSSAAGLTPYAEMPRNLTPRAVESAVAGTEFAAWIVVYDPATYAAIQAGTTTLDFRDAGGTVHTGTVIAKRGERPRGTIRP